MKASEVEIAAIRKAADEQASTAFRKDWEKFEAYDQKRGQTQGMAAARFGLPSKKELQESIEGFEQEEKDRKTLAKDLLGYQEAMIRLQSGPGGNWKPPRRFSRCASSRRRRWWKSRRLRWITSNKRRRSRRKATRRTRRRWIAKRTPSPANHPASCIRSSPGRRNSASNSAACSMRLCSSRSPKAWAGCWGMCCAPSCTARRELAGSPVFSTVFSAANRIQ